jgi:hypothetical protein
MDDDESPAERFVDEAKGIRHPRSNAAGYIQASRYGTAVVVDPLEEVRQLCEAIIGLSDPELRKAGVTAEEYAEVEYIYDVALAFKQAYIRGPPGEKVVSLPLPFLGNSGEEDGASLTEFSTRWLPASDAREIVFLGPAKMDAVAAVVQRFPQPKYFVDEKGDKCVDGWQEVQEAYTVLNALKDYITVESYENLRVRFCSYALKRLLKIQRKTLSLLNEAAMESAFKK